MKKYFYDFLLLLQILTRIPINKAFPCEKDDFKNGSNFFVIVGLLIGTCQYLLFIALHKIIPPNFAVIIIIIFEVMITGAFHIDGFCDTCDGFFAFKGKDKIIDIMKDSRIGTFGCIGVVLNFMIKYEGYLFIVSNSKTLYILMLPMISRFSIALLCLIGKPAKEKGSGNLFIDTVSLKEVIVNLIFVLAMGLFMKHIFVTIILLISASIVTSLFNLLCNSKINGVTGDSLGANNELVMLLSFIILSSMYLA